MKTTQEDIIKTLQEQVLFLEENLAEKDKIIAQKEAVLSEQEVALTKNKTELTTKQQVVSEQKATIEHLKHQLAQLRRMLYGSKRERFVPEHPNQLTIPFDMEDAQVEQIIEADTEKISYERKRYSKPHPGRIPLPSHLPVKEILLEPKEDTTGMTCIGQQITDELEYIAPKLFINRYIRNIYLSQEDERGNQRQVVAELDRPIDKCIAGTDLLSQIVVDKFVFHMPLYRQLQRFKLENIDIKASTLDSWMRLLSKHIRPLYPVHQAYILGSNYLQADESPIKVLDRDKPGATHQGYMWVYRAPVSKALFFEYNKGRSEQSPLKNLSTFNGYLQSDGYIVYDNIVKGRKITHVACWAHARRMFEQALAYDKVLAGFVLEKIQTLYAIERRARELGVTAYERKEIRLNDALPILNEIGEYIAGNRSKVLPKSPIGKAFGYCVARWDNLLNYLHDGILEIDNNLIENSIRPLALGRKNYLFAGSHDAAQEIAMFYSFFGTCKQHDIHPQKWLAYVIRHIKDTKPSQLKNLLPQYMDKTLLI